MFIFLLLYLPSFRIHAGVLGSSYTLPQRAFDILRRFYFCVLKVEFQHIRKTYVRTVYGARCMIRNVHLHSFGKCVAILFTLY